MGKTQVMFLHSPCLSWLAYRFSEDHSTPPPACLLCCIYLFFIHLLLPRVSAFTLSWSSVFLWCWLSNGFKNLFFNTLFIILVVVVDYCSRYLACHGMEIFIYLKKIYFTILTHIPLDHSLLHFAFQHSKLMY